MFGIFSFSYFYFLWAVLLLFAYSLRATHWFTKCSASLLTNFYSKLDWLDYMHLFEVWMCIYICAHWPHRNANLQTTLTQTPRIEQTSPAVEMEETRFTPSNWFIHGQAVCENRKSLANVKSVSHHASKKSWMSIPMCKWQSPPTNT